jgi:tmRNA-binding protein
MADRTVAQNRKARHDYFILETFECGIVLTGTEIKSVRDGKVNLKEGYALIRNGELWLVGVHISPL